MHDVLIDTNDDYSKDIVIIKQCEIMNNTITAYLTIRLNLIPFFKVVS